MAEAMNVPLLDLGRQWEGLEEEVLAEVAAVFRERDFCLGTRVAALEAEIAEYCGVAHAIGCGSGTDALLLALKALDIGAGDEVVTTPFTFFATAGTIWNAGAKPVFADIDPTTFNLDPAASADAVTSRTRALMPVHLYGQCADMTPLLALARAKGLAVIEDTAQAIGAEYEGRRAGSLGDAGALSFYPSKNLGGAGEGGMIVTNRDDVAERLRMARNHGQAAHYVHAFVGTNSRLDGLQAAVLRSKLRRLDAWHAGRAERAARYDAALGDVEAIRTPLHTGKGRHVYNQYVIRCERRDDLRDHLTARGIGTGIYYPIPLHLQECFAPLGYRRGQFPESERATQECLALPIFPELTEAEQDYVIATIRAYYGASRV